MTADSDRDNISRRQLLAAVGAGAAAAVTVGAGALPASSVGSWDAQADVLIVGSGAAGVSAAIEARAAGAGVLLLESLSRLGGASAMSGGVVYAGGGTALQKALGVDDNVEAILSRAGAPHPPLDKIQLYCEQSAAHFDWLVAQGVPYLEKFSAAKGLPMGDESLYFSPGRRRAGTCRGLQA
jgi:3-oxo-5alpha-steroid 4-dehydrogenase